MALSTGKRQTFNEINITPLTDIFLVLLIIMMVVAPLLDSSGLKLSVPSVSPSEDVTEDPKVMKININAQGEFMVDQDRILPAALVGEIRKAKEANPDGVIIQADPESSHEALTYAMDAVQTAGVTKLAVTSAEKDEDQAADTLNSLPEMPAQ
ncbi:MAG: ExbD/TolR family protein [Candidatus Melainabacteria bacterium]